MVAEKVKVVFEGETVDAEEVPFSVGSPAEAVFDLADGARITFQHHVRSIYRLCDKKREDGSPIYMLAGEARIHVQHAKKGG